MENYSMIPVSPLAQYALHDMYQRHHQTIQRQNAEFTDLIKLVKMSDKIPDDYTLDIQQGTWVKTTASQAVIIEEDTTQPTKDTIND